MKLRINVFMIAPILIIGWVFSTADDAKTPTAPGSEQRMFIGVDKCVTCHKTAKQGEQYRIWSEGPHAKAYAALAGDQAKAIAKKKGIDDPQKASECLRCHVTGHGVDAKYLGDKYKVEDGVGCESCHGAGGDYYKMNTMKAITAGELDGATLGLVEPTEALCKQCHNEESPTYKAFNYETAVKQIAHPIPSKK